MLNQLFGGPNRIQQERTVLTNSAQHIVHVQIGLNMTSHEIGRIHQICRANRRIAETQVRTGETSRLFRIVGEIGLTIFIGIVTDNLYRVLVSTYRTIGSQTIKFSLEDTFATQCQFFFRRKRRESDIIDNTDSKVVLRLRQRQVFIYRQNLCRSRIFRSQTITTANDKRSIGFTIKYIFNIEIQRFAISARFFGTIEHSHTFNRLRQGRQEMFCRERTI